MPTLTPTTSAMTTRAASSSASQMERVRVMNAFLPYGY